MSSDRDQLTERRDQALRDLVELERQVDEGEIPAGVADGLRARYEATAAAALAELDTTPEPTPAPAPPRRSRSRVLAYAATALGALVAAAVLLPQSIGERPAGGFVTGNEVTQSPGDRPVSTSDPAMQEALWFKANMQLYGLKDPAAALETLQLLRQRQDLPAAVREQVEQLAATARQRREAGP